MKEVQRELKGREREREREREKWETDRVRNDLKNSQNVHGRKVFQYVKTVQQKFPKKTFLEKLF